MHGETVQWKLERLAMQCNWGIVIRMRQTIGKRWEYNWNAIGMLLKAIQTNWNAILKRLECYWESWHSYQSLEYFGELFEIPCSFWWVYWLFMAQLWKHGEIVQWAGNACNAFETWRANAASTANYSTYIETWSASTEAKQLELEGLTELWRPGGPMRKVKHVFDFFFGTFLDILGQIWQQCEVFAVLKAFGAAVARASIAVKEFNNWGMEILHWRTSIAIEVWRANWVMDAWRAREAI